MAFGGQLVVEAVAIGMAESAFPVMVVVQELTERLAVLVTLQFVLQLALPPQLRPSSSSYV